MPRSFYRQALAAGTVEDQDLAQALAGAQPDWCLPPTVDALKSVLDYNETSGLRHPAHVATVAEVLNELADGDKQVARTQFMIDEISRWCAA